MRTPEPARRLLELPERPLFRVLERSVPSSSPGLWLLVAAAFAVLVLVATLLRGH